MRSGAVREEILQLRLKGLRLPAFLAHYAALASAPPQKAGGRWSICRNWWTWR